MKEYLKMGDDFKSSDMPMLVEGIATIKGVGINKALSIMHAINSHDELVAEVERLSGIIERAILASNDLSSRCASTQWGDGYRECAIDTGNALKVELNKGA